MRTTQRSVRFLDAIRLHISCFRSYLSAVMNMFCLGFYCFTTRQYASCVFRQAFPPLPLAVVFRLHSIQLPASVL